MVVDGGVHAALVVARLAPEVLALEVTAQPLPVALHLFEERLRGNHEPIRSPRHRGWQERE